jgi:succinate dehydrogenase/fumarate reductase cytochrome b subunit
VILYFIGIVVFGFLYWLLNGIVTIFRDMNIANTTDFTPYDLLLYIWAGIVIVYLVFGGIWMVRSFQRQNMYGGM